MRDHGESPFRMRVALVQTLTLEAALEQIEELRVQLSEEQELRRNAEKERVQAEAERKLALKLKLAAEEEARRAQEEAEVDPLTGVRNIRGFERAAEFAISTTYGPRTAPGERRKRKRNEIAIGVFDADNFKWVNDTFGHAEGDKVIKAIARSLVSICRENVDIISRPGGDEFKIMFMGLTARGVQIRLRSKFHDPQTRHVRIRIPAEIKEKSGETKTIVIQLSGGLTDIAPWETKEAASERADTALYLAKEQGGGKVLKLSAPDRSKISTPFASKGVQGS